ncbi:MAG: hypothetical protein NC251_08080 [Lachnoclostridium sp.]|nr:hypothetical protein [Lachnospira sp.]MCM1248371.1 hypothetical protein [Lachnoclostridium sp.]
MLKRINQVLNIIIGCFVGVAAGNGVYVYLDHKAHPDLYAAWSAPWYASILVCGMVAVIVLIVCFGIKFIIRKIEKE